MAKARWKWVFTVVSAMFILKFPIACGMNFGQKMKAGDNRTPEGIFKVVSRNLRHIGPMISGKDRWKELTGLCLSG